MLWLDLANAYSSIPHKLVQTTMTKHHVPHHVVDLILDYYEQFRMRVTMGEITSVWHKLEVGIIIGCTISVTLFALAMNMFVKSAEPECRGPQTQSGTRQSPIRAFMDDLTVTTESVPGCRWILQGLDRLIRWAQGDSNQPSPDLSWRRKARLRTGSVSTSKGQQYHQSQRSL